ncbi:MAG: hypothetical protein KDA84_28785 [Planctomycetaceae bacterium]|nr:hypothetical protein [Planctomycetaceae bacterium]
MTDHTDLETIRSRLAERLGWSAFNRLVESVPEVRKRGKLRFWQERLLKQVSQQETILSTVVGFLEVFEGADRVPVPTPAEPWTRDAFLSQIEAFPHVAFPLDKTPPEWMAAAWEIENVRDELCWDMARTVSKLGELCYTEEYLDYLSRSLPTPRQVELFLTIRDRCPGREEEFRPGFERAFPECVPQLPSPLTIKELANQMGITEDESNFHYCATNQISYDGENPSREFEDDIPFEVSEDDIPF